MTRESCVTSTKSNLAAHLNSSYSSVCKLRLDLDEDTDDLRSDTGIMVVGITCSYGKPGVLLSETRQELPFSPDFFLSLKGRFKLKKKIKRQDSRIDAKAMQKN